MVTLTVKKGNDRLQKGNRHGCLSSLLPDKWTVQQSLKNNHLSLRMYSSKGPSAANSNTKIKAF